MKALLVIDTQNGIINQKDFTDELTHMANIMDSFKDGRRPGIFLRHMYDTGGSPLYKDSIGSELHHSLRDYADYVFEKTTSNAFYKTE